MLADLNKSTPPINPTIDVSLSNVINSLTKVGKILFIADILMQSCYIAYFQTYINESMFMSVIEHSLLFNF